MTIPQSTEREALRAVARTVVTQCPDLQQQARDIARQLLARHSLDDDPDQVHWHRFIDQASSRSAFSGWVHYQKPIQSLTLVELVVERFGAEDSEYVDALDSQSGFYRAGADADYFDERNEVPILPSEALKLFWSIDLATRFQAEAEGFWSAHGDDYRTLAKARAIAEVVQAQAHRTLTDTDATFILDALTDSSRPDADLEMLKARVVPTAPIGFLRIGQHQATDILHLLNDQRHYLYLPGEVEPWVACEGIEALHWWLLMHCNEADNRARFVRHFALRSALAEDGKDSLNHTLDLLYSAWGAGNRNLLVPVGKALNEDPFSALQRRVQARMLDDAQLKLVSNATLSKQLWLNYLGSFSRIFGPMAAADWPVALACVIVDSTEIGLHLDLALDSRNSAARQGHYTAAALACVNLFFDSLTLWRGHQPSSTAPLPAPADTSLTLPEAVPERLYPTDDLLAQHFQVNKSLDGVSAGTQGDMQEIHTLDGHFYIQLQGAVYEVRRSSALNCWRIVDPASPYAFGRHALVRLGEDGAWQLVPLPGLAGGGGTLGRLRGVEPVPAYQPPPGGPYAIPPEHREALAAHVNDPTSEVFDDDESHIAGDSAANNALEIFRGKREGLVMDAQAFHLSHPIGALPQVPKVDPQASARSIINSLLEGKAGLVLGEVHSDTGAKGFLIRNLQSLRKAGVTTLYMEHLLGDFHQADLATTLLEQRMPEKLQQWLKALDLAHGLTGKTSFTYGRLVSLASEAGIRVVPLDNLASAHTLSLEDPDLNLRQSTLNYHAYLRIENDSPGRGAGKWVALVGQTHASAYHGIVGLDQLLEVPTIRFEDVEPGVSTRIEPDPGLLIPALGNQPADLLKSAYVLSTPTPFKGLMAIDMIRPTGLLPHKSFRIKPSGDSWLLTIRLTDNQQTEVRVQTVDDRYHIQVPGLGPVNERQYYNLDQLVEDLRRYGLQLVT